MARASPPARIIGRRRSIRPPWTRSARPTSALPPSPASRSPRTRSTPARSPHALRRKARARRAHVPLLHGQPTWAYLYRRMIPAFVVRARASSRPISTASAARTSRATKPGTRHAHGSAGRVRGAARSALDHARLPGLGRDPGLTLPMDMPDRFAQLVVMNTALGTGDAPLGEGFLRGGPGRRRTRTSTSQAAEASLPAPHRRGGRGERRALSGRELQGGRPAFPECVPNAPDADGRRSRRQARDCCAANGTDRRSWRSAQPTRCSGRR